jgi:hypothetical protein
MECCKMISKETRCFSTKEDGDADVGWGFSKITHLDREFIIK